MYCVCVCPVPPVVNASVSLLQISHSSLTQHILPLNFHENIAQWLDKENQVAHKHGRNSSMMPAWVCVSVCACIINMHTQDKAMCKR